MQNSKSNAKSSKRSGNTTKSSSERGKTKDNQRFKVKGPKGGNKGKSKFSKESQFCRIHKRELWKQVQGSGNGNLIFDASNFPLWFMSISRLYEHYRLRHVTIDIVSSYSGMASGSYNVTYNNNPGQRAESGDATIMSAQYNSIQRPIRFNGRMELPGSCFSQTPSYKCTRGGEYSTYSFDVGYKIATGEENQGTVSFFITYDVEFRTPTSTGREIDTNVFNGWIYDVDNDATITYNGSSNFEVSSHEIPLSGQQSPAEVKAITFPGGTATSENYSLYVNRFDGYAHDAICWAFGSTRKEAVEHALELANILYVQIVQFATGDENASFTAAAWNQFRDDYIQDGKSKQYGGFLVNIRANKIKITGTSTFLTSATFGFNQDSGDQGWIPYTASGETFRNTAAQIWPRTSTARQGSFACVIVGGRFAFEIVGGSNTLIREPGYNSFAAIFPQASAQ
jgi:archaellum component FlaF (FlaF/FlaG flagellin family)